MLAPEGWPGLEISWALKRPFWGTRIRHGSRSSSLDFALDQLGHTHVISMILSENTASIRVAKRLGMRLEGSAELMGFPVVVYGIRRPRTGVRSVSSPSS